MITLIYQDNYVATEKSTKDVVVSQAPMISRLFYSRMYSCNAVWIFNLYPSRRKSFHNHESADAIEANCLSLKIVNSRLLYIVNNNKH